MVSVEAARSRYARKSTLAKVVSILAFCKWHRSKLPTSLETFEIGKHITSVMGQSTANACVRSAQSCFRSARKQNRSSSP